MITAISSANRNTSLNNTKNKFGAKTSFISSSKAEIKARRVEDKICKAISSNNVLVRTYGHIRRVIYNVFSNKDIITSTGGKVYKRSGLNGLDHINL